jgi:hypothetical protein
LGKGVKAAWNPRSNCNRGARPAVWQEPDPPTHRPVEHAGAAEARAERTASSPRWSTLGIGGAFGIAVAFIAIATCDSIAASPGEPGWLRWLRVFADHPIRGAIAASLLFFAFSPRAPVIADRDGTRSA